MRHSPALSFSHPLSDGRWIIIPDTTVGWSDDFRPKQPRGEPTLPMIDVRVLSNVNGLEDAVIIATEVYTRSIRMSGNDPVFDEQNDSLEILIIS